MSARAMQEALKGLASKRPQSAPAPVVRTVVRDGEPKVRKPITSPKHPKAKPSLPAVEATAHSTCGRTWSVMHKTTWGSDAVSGHTCSLKPNHQGDCQCECKRVARRSA